jgi:hypothetical protein
MPVVVSLDPDIEPPRGTADGLMFDLRSRVEVGHVIRDYFLSS